MGELDDDGLRLRLTPADRGIYSLTGEIRLRLRKLNKL